MLLNLSRHGNIGRKILIMEQCTQRHTHFKKPEAVAKQKNPKNLNVSEYATHSLRKLFHFSYQCYFKPLLFAPRGYYQG